MAENLADIIKKLGLGAVEASAPVTITYGTVTSINPLVITTEQKLPLSKEFLILTKNVMDYTVDVTIDWNTDSRSLNHNHDLNGEMSVSSNASVSPNPDNINVKISNEVSNGLSIGYKDLTHSHPVRGRKQMTVHNGLKLNDKVILISKQGGEEYIVLDKI